MATGNTLSMRDLDFSVQSLPSSSSQQDLAGITPAMLEQPIKKSLAALESRIITEALRLHNGNVQKVTQVLQIGKTALYAKMKRYGISARDMKQ